MLIGASLIGYNVEAITSKGLRSDALSTDTKLMRATML